MDREDKPIFLCVSLSGYKETRDKPTHCKLRTSQSCTRRLHVPYEIKKTMTGTQLQDGQSGLPTTQSTQSYWHKNPSTVLLGHRTTEKLPPTADVVVVGTGITGTFAARELVAGGRGVVHVEAREACWGATGRVSNEAIFYLYACSESPGETEAREFLVHTFEQGTNTC